MKDEPMRERRKGNLLPVGSEEARALVAQILKIPKTDPMEAAEEERRNAAREKERLVRRMEEAGLGGRLRDTSFETVRNRGVPCGMEGHVDFMEEWASHFKEHLRRGEGIMLMGMVGRMKTTLSVCAARCVLEAGYSPFFITLPRLLFLTRTLSGGDQGEFLRFEERARKTPLLIVDDLGAEYATPYTTAFVDALIAERYERNLSLMVTTNLDYEAIGKTYGVRIRDRLEEMTEKLIFTGKSLRGKGAASN